VSDSTYTPPRVWTWNKDKNGGTFASINRPVAGPTHERELPVGAHPLQLYSLGTPNGVKVTILLEELLALGHAGAEYDAWLVDIGKGDQFGSGFVAVNPNSKIPALVDRTTSPPTRVFESGAILMYLAEKFGALLPSSGPARAEVLSWLFWQMGSAPYLGGGFGHFLRLRAREDRVRDRSLRHGDEAPARRARPPALRERLPRRRHVHDRRRRRVPLVRVLAQGKLYNAGEFLDVASYTNVVRWAEGLAARPAVKRGSMVNRTFGAPETQLRERHDASDFDTKTADKVAPPG
jgi:GST-like protein